MHFAFIRELFSGHITSAFCWTLVHSLWQGLFFGIMTGLILIGTKNSKPSLRYRILSAQFLLFILVVLITFIWEWNVNSYSNTFQNHITANAIDTSGGNQDVIIHSTQSYQVLDTLSAFLSANAPLLVAAWFIIFFVKSIKIITSLVYLQHLRAHKAYQPSLYWKSKIEQLCSQLGISKAVQLLESEVIKVPAVFGHLKPVIFVPFGILTGLPPEQVEAILLHELAHIRRRDYLFNLVQNIAETIFFFNPALLWMSSVIREEREHCCDDIAIEQTNDKRQFVESLIRFREIYMYSHSRHVTAFPGPRNSFVNRITRIAMNKNKSLHPAENIFLAVSLLIIGTLVMAFCQIKEPVPPKAAPVMEASVPPAAPLPPAVVASVPKMPAAIPENVISPKIEKDALPVDTIPDADKDDYSVIYSDIDKSAGRETIVFKKGKNEYKLVRLNGEIAYLLVNDDKVSKDRMSEYSELIKTITAQLERMRKEQAIRDEEQRQRNIEQEQRNAEQAIRNKEQDQRNAEQAVRNEEHRKRDSVQVIKNKEQEQRNAEQAVRNKEQEQRNAEQAVRNKEQEKRNAEQEIRNKEQAVRNAQLNKLIDELITDNIIKSRKELHSMSIADGEFIVNGVKQSPEVYKKYKTKYDKLIGNSYNFRYSID